MRLSSIWKALWQVSSIAKAIPWFKTFLWCEIDTKRESIADCELPPCIDMS
jgi:hypothetical protein